MVLGWGGGRWGCDWDGGGRVGRMHVSAGVPGGVEWRRREGLEQEGRVHNGCCC